MPVVEAESAIAKADEVILDYGPHRHNLVYVLQDIQQQFDYLPRPALRRVAEKLDVPLAEVLRVATFYRAFSLEPLGEHLISVCMGTACHVKGAPRILDALRRRLKLAPDRETTDDMRFTVRSVRCIGCCGLAPVITVDRDTHGRLTPDRIPKILQRYE